MYLFFMPELTPPRSIYKWNGHCLMKTSPIVDIVVMVLGNRRRYHANEIEPVVLNTIVLEMLGELILHSSI